jgi:hypothetical protein
MHTRHSIYIGSRSPCPVVNQNVRYTVDDNLPITQTPLPVREDITQPIEEQNLLSTLRMFLSNLEFLLYLKDGDISMKMHAICKGELYPVSPGLWCNQCTRSQKSMQNL